MKTILYLIIIVSGCLLHSLAEAAAGKILLATGEVFLTDPTGAQQPVNTGMSIEPGETVTTKSGRAQIKFADGGLISLQPATEFKVDDYKYGTGKGAQESAAFTLVKGGLRAVTGLIGKQRKQAYQMQTEVATIGIRGTEYQLVICSGNCDQPDGLYVRTGEGLISVKNAVGEIEVGAGHTAYVASANSAPEHTSSGPAINANKQNAEPESLPGVASSSEFRSGDILITQSVLGEFTVLDSAGLALAGSGSVARDGQTYFGAGAAAGAGFNNTGGTLGVFLLNNKITAITASYQGQVVTITPSSVAQVFADGGLYWGRWTNTSFDVFAGLNTALYREKVTLDANSSLHYILGTSVPTVPGTGTATYNFIGGTASTDESGMVGSGITSGSLTANFNMNTVDANLMVNHGGAYNLLATMPLSNNRASFSSDNPGGFASAGAYTAKVGGFFAGSNTANGPSRAGVSYEIQQPGNSIVGVGAFGIQ